MPRTPSGSPVRSALVALALTLLGAGAARADDTEVFVSGTAAAGVRANILLILDTSSGMEALLTTGKSPYDPTREYTGACDEDRIFWRKGPGDPPRCTTRDYFFTTQNSCDAAHRALTSTAGLWTGRAAQFDRGRKAWRALRAARDHDDDDDGPGDGDDDRAVECAIDSGVHGETAGSAARWARNDKSAWTTDARHEISWSTVSQYTLYSANWLNWFYAPPDGTPITRLEALQAAAGTLAYSIGGVNLGLMRLSSDGDGGMVTDALANIVTNRDTVVSRLESFEAGGPTSLAETLYEAGQYFTGRTVDFGIDSVGNGGALSPSVTAARSPASANFYGSPIQFQCQRNFIILMSDGEVDGDEAAQARIEALPGFSAVNPGGCDATGCLEEMARYLRNTDLAGERLTGPQNAVTYTVGLGPDFAGSALLARTAEAGGGEAFGADDVVGLTEALQEVVSDIAARSSTFTTPSVSVNAFSRTETSRDLYISVFEPTETYHWPGNLKKYGLVNGRIVDADGDDAVDPTTGFFAAGSRSIWTTGSPDGGRVSLGGAVSHLPGPAARGIYTFLEAEGDTDLTADVNELSVANAAVSDELLGTSPDGPTRAEVIEWARGIDVRDADRDGDTAEHRRFMGDPLHARPALVAYGADEDESVVFVPTNDGFLHAIDAETGTELWSFIPQELLPRLVELHRDAGVVTRTYGLDGDVRVLRFDANQDGTIAAADGDRIFLYFGMRRGGQSYYALDVTNRTRPKMLWRIGATASDGASVLPGIGETWSTPTIARVNVDGATQNGEKLVLIFGGGYDEGQEDFAFRTDTVGHRIYMVDAATGKLLWFAGGPDGAGSPDLALASMTHSIPGRITVIDTDGNGLADRMYAADTGGRVWRFDIWNGRSAGSLVTGGVFANLGAAGSSDPAIQDTRRFYYAPDVALIQRRGAPPYYNIAIGSGYRGHPLHRETRDRFYSLRDRNPFNRLTQGDYDGFTAITDGALTDLTSDIAGTGVPRDSRGWKVELRLNGGWVGEKVLAEAVTINGTILFPTYQPQDPEAANPCLPANGINRVYALQAETGRPALDFNDDLSLTNEDAWTGLVQTGIAGEVSFALETRAGSGGSGDGSGDGDVEAGPRDALGRSSVCMVGIEVLKKCVGPGNVVRTFWQRKGTN